MFQSPDDLLTITGSVVTSFGGKSTFLTWVQARRSQQKKSMFSLAVLMQY